MKELILLEQWILSKPATNAQHREAIAWLRAIEEQLVKLSQKDKDA